MLMAIAIKKWTLEELHSLPDDGNKYELIRGELFVTPAPTDFHETISARLTEILVPYVAAHGLGHVYRPRAIVRFEGSEVEPDLMVRRAQAQRHAGWDTAPLPILVIEILSPTTRRRDREQKREFYLASGLPEYWIVDPDHESILVIRPNQPDVITDTTLTWSPAVVNSPLLLDVKWIFS